MIKKYIKFIVILFISLMVMGFTKPTQSWVDYSDEGNMRYGVFDGIWCYSDSVFIGNDTVPVWKFYTVYGDIDTLVVDSLDVNKITVDTLKVDSINTRTAVITDTLIVGDNKVYDDGNYIVFNSRISQKGLGQSTYLGDSAGLNDDLTYNANTGVGYGALYTNTDGFNNVAVGKQSLYNNISGYENMATGYQALYTNTTGAENMAIGYKSLFYNTTGNYNTAVGGQSFFYNTTGEWNVAIGSHAGNSIVGGGSNATAYKSIYIGTYCKAYADGDTNEIVIGAYAEGAGDNTVTIGDTLIIKTVLRGKVEADSIKSDSIYTQELLVDSIARIMYLKWADDRDLSIHCQSLFELAKGRFSTNQDTLFIATDTITDMNEGVVFIDTTGVAQVRVYENSEWHGVSGVDKFIEIYINAPDSLMNCVQNTWYPLNMWTQGCVNGMTLAGDSIVVINSAGIYDIKYSISYTVSGAINHHWLTGISVKNAVPARKTRAYMRVTNLSANDINGSCMLDLALHDTLRVEVMDTTGSNAEFIVNYGNFNMQKIKDGTR